MKTFIWITLLIGTVSLSFGRSEITGSIEEAKIDTFTFNSDGKDINGRIYLPASFSKEKNFYSIYLIDFTEQHFRVAKDEFEKVISAAEGIQDLDAVVVTLEEHLDVDAAPDMFQKYYDLYKNMTLYVDDNYTNNPSRTFVARGSEAGLVMMTLFLEDSTTSVFENFVGTDSPSSFNQYIRNLINGEHFPKAKSNKKLHFSFSTSNNRVDCTSLINTINQAQFPWLQFESKEYRNSDYENTYPAAFAEGLSFVFNDLTTGMDKSSLTVPTGFRLDQNYPNPFNPHTTIKYSIPGITEYNSVIHNVTLKVFDLLGRELATLVEKNQNPGNYRIEFDGSNLKSGTYFYRLQFGEFVETKKMTLLK